MAEELPPEWEAVTDAEGRTYWWNVRTNETTWKKPVLVVAKKRSCCRLRLQREE